MSELRHALASDVAQDLRDSAAEALDHHGFCNVHCLRITPLVKAASMFVGTPAARGHCLRSEVRARTAS